MKRFLLTLAFACSSALATPWVLLQGGVILQPIPYTSLDACTAAAKRLAAGTYQCDASVPVVVAAPTWKKIATEGGTATLVEPQMVRFGLGANFIVKPFPAGALRCDVATFGSDPLFGTVKECDLKSGPPIVIPAPPPVVDHSGMGPMVDMTKVPARAVFPETLRIQTTWRDGTRWYNANGQLDPACTGWGGGCQTDVLDDNCPAEGPWCYIRAPQIPSGPHLTDIGAFRLPCDFGWMSNDDAIVYPNQPGKSHLHEGVGQLPPDLSVPTDPTVDYPSSCEGGRANQTRYWHPALIDTLDGTPLKTTKQVSYYKSGYDVPLPLVLAAEPVPAGLRMIVGNAANMDPNFAIGSFTCFRSPDGAQSPSFNNFVDLGNARDATGVYCNEGADMIVGASFPQCWDGTNLDSANHQSHVVDVVNRSCPLDHPHILVKHSQNWHYTVHAGQVARIRLSSDKYDTTLPGGLSYHQDVWFNWKPEIMQMITNNCVDAQFDCAASLLNDKPLMRSLF